MPVPNKPTTGQKASITRGLNLQAATKKDVQLLSEEIASIEKHLATVQKDIITGVKKAVNASIDKRLAKAQKEIVRAVKRAIKRRGRKR